MMESENDIEVLFKKGWMMETRSYINDANEHRLWVTLWTSMLSLMKSAPIIARSLL